MQYIIMRLQCRVLLKLGARSSLFKAVYCVGHKISLLCKSQGAFFQTQHISGLIALTKLAYLARAGRRRSQ